MDKGKKASIAAAVLILVIVAVVTFGCRPVRPLSKLTAAEVASAEVYAIPPDQSVELPQEELETVVALLNALTVSRPGYGLSGQLAGQAVTITVCKTDETAIKIENIGNEIIVIDGVRYKADYRTAEALNAFANQALGTGF